MCFGIVVPLCSNLKPDEIRDTEFEGAVTFSLRAYTIVYDPNQTPMEI